MKYIENTFSLEYNLRKCDMEIFMIITKLAECEIFSVGSKQSIQAITDYPLTEVERDKVRDMERKLEGMTVEQRAAHAMEPITPYLDMLKPVTIISYDRNKYCKILYKNEIYTVKSGYLYKPSLEKEMFRSGGFWFKPYSYKQLCELPDVELIE